MGKEVNMNVQMSMWVRTDFGKEVGEPKLDCVMLLREYCDIMHDKWKNIPQNTRTEKYDAFRQLQVP